MSYQHGASRHTLTGVRNQNRILQARLDHANLVITELQQKKRPPRKGDDYPPITPEALQAELEKARRRFPEPAEVKEARLRELDQAARPRPRLKTAA